MTRLRRHADVRIVEETLLFDSGDKELRLLEFSSNNNATFNVRLLSHLFVLNGHMQAR